MDVVLETPGGRIAGIEVKASSSIGARDFAGLKTLAQIAGDKFVRGVVLYLGQNVVPFSPRFWAVPVSGLWSA